MEEARHIITYYHANGDANHPICDMEMNEISQSLEAEGMTTFRTFFDLRVLVKSRSRAYRLMLCMASNHPLSLSRFLNFCSVVFPELCFIFPGSRWKIYTNLL